MRISFELWPIFDECMAYLGAFWQNMKLYFPWNVDVLYFDNTDNDIYPSLHLLPLTSSPPLLPLPLATRTYSVGAISFSFSLRSVFSVTAASAAFFSSPVILALFLWLSPHTGGRECPQCPGLPLSLPNHSGHPKMFGDLKKKMTIKDIYIYIYLCQ